MLPIFTWYIWSMYWWNGTNGCHVEEWSIEEVIMLVLLSHTFEDSQKLIANFCMYRKRTTQPIPPQKFVWQVCLCNTFLFAVVIHPILTMLHNATRGIFGTTFTTISKSLYCARITNDHIMFSGAMHDNIVKDIEMWDLFAVASSLKISMHN